MAYPVAQQFTCPQCGRFFETIVTCTAENRKCGAAPLTPLCCFCKAQNKRNSLPFDDGRSTVSAPPPQQPVKQPVKLTLNNHSDRNHSEVLITAGKLLKDKGAWLGAHMDQDHSIQLDDPQGALRYILSFRYGYCTTIEVRPVVPYGVTAVQPPDH